MSTLVAPQPVASTSATPRPSSAVSKADSTMTGSKLERSSRASDEDSKTSVKVAIRIRPPLKPSDPGFELIPQRFQRSMVQNTSQNSLAVDSPQGRKLFIFDRVFGTDVGQGGVFEYINPGIDAFLQGYNVSVMAYGQSGAGKSYTMGTSGPAEQGDRTLMGVVPRAAMSLFAKLIGSPGHSRGSSGLKAPNRYSMSLAPGALNGKTEKDQDWQLKATYLEIYNEQLRDLLISGDTPVEMRPSPTIREDKGKILLTGLTQVDINSTEDLLNALNYGSSIRQTDATAINARSSRSHAIFSLNLVQKRPKSQSDKERRLSMPADNYDVVTTDSKLHFVDLAGSERLKNTGASGDRAKEGIAINAGLASLGKVISQLSSRSAGAHVSYRDSKLTRILQDSLGGNAITYLVACVTPAEFHLSETLNTVQYAQRARAIQSKPQIQRVNEDGDKQGLIDRLRAEIAFLRDQIKISQQQQQQQTGGANGTVERSDERETELQEQLLGVQESYSALSKRHARLISEISKAGNEAERSATDLGATPAERIERANSMNKIIDTVVSEYEETIQTLQTQMRDNKAALSTSESKVLENESRIAYVQKINDQLQTRTQKFMERETGLESYVRDLESRLDGRISTDDRNSEIVSDLRKQINKLRDTEVANEDYITNLEERLAEAEQDMELMNREINRLENVVERQRSVGRLDSLMMELNNIQKKGEAAAATEKLATTNGHMPMADYEAEPRATHELAVQTPIPESGDTSLVATPRTDSLPDLTIDPAQSNTDQQPAHSPSQMQFVEEKLDAVNQELVALRVEHESTCTEYDLLADKYQEALRTLAAMQRAVDNDEELPSSSTAFLADARVNELKKEGGQFSSSQSQSSDLSSAAASPTANDESDQQTEIAYGEGVRSTPATSISSTQVRPLSDISERLSQPPTAQVITKEVEQLKSLASQKDRHIEKLSTELVTMKAEHDKALETLASMKSEVQRAKAGSPASPTQFVRRKSGHSVLGSDRTNRAFVSLSNIAADHLEDKPDTRENFQIQLTALSNELQSRGERIENLETEVSNAKKEMEAKMQIISGLARERSSMIAASPVDVSVVSSMRDQLVQNENHIKALQDQLGSRESELGKEVRALKAALAGKDGGEVRDPDASPALSAVNDMANERNEEMVSLREEIANLKASEKQLVATINELEETLSSVDRIRQEKAAEAEDHARVAAAATSALDAERQKLTEELVQQKATIETHSSRYDALQSAYENMQRELNDHSGLSEASIAQLENHRAQIDQLEQHLQSQYDAIEEYKETIGEMARTHEKELDEMQALIQQHDIEASKDIPEGEEGTFELQKRLAASEVSRSTAESTLAELKSKLDSLTTVETQLKQENEQLRDKGERTSRLVDQLEGQLATSYQDSQQNSNRLSSLRRTSQQEVAEARAAAVKAQEQIVELQTRLQQYERAGTPSQPDMPERANSMASRKSIGIGALPSPPPAIPLPPLPATSPMVGTFGAAGSTDGRPKSPPTTSLKRDSATQLTIQEQEARIRTVEKHLNAEKQLTATLEEALVDLENQGDKVKKEAESWRKRAQQIETELNQMKQERNTRQRDSQQLLEDERNRRRKEEDARRQLEAKFEIIRKQTKPKNNNPFNCF